jgi:long-chain acyl-CoA synthetase
MVAEEPARGRPWLASYPPGVPTTYAYPTVPLTRLLDDAAADFPDVIAVHFRGFEQTYRTLLDRVDRFATVLADLGVRRGDRVGVLLPNCPQHLVALFGALRIGAVAAEIGHTATPEQLEHQLNEAGCEVVVCLDPVYPRLAQLKGRLATVQHIIATGLQDALPMARRALFPLVGRRAGTYHRIREEEGVLRFADLLERAAPMAAQESLDPHAALALLRFTASGKAAAFTHANLVANAFQVRLWVPDIQAGREHVLGVVPLSTPYGVTTVLGVGLLSAATMTLVSRSDRDQVLRTIDRRKPTILPATERLLDELAAAPAARRHDLTSVRVCLSGDGPLSDASTATLEELTGGKVRGGYTLADGGPLTHANPIYGRAKRGTVGLPLPDTACRIADPDDPSRVLPPGAKGTLHVAGPQVMAGARSNVRDGWLATDDVASMDAEGYVTLLGR